MVYRGLSHQGNNLLDFMPRILKLFIGFGCVGITGEMLFTAFSGLVDGISTSHIDWSLAGKSYIWMFPIYGFAGLLFHIFWARVSSFKWYLRLFLYVGVIYVLEFTSGAAIDAVTGSCPWEYTTGWHVMGYIRLDYFPFWFAFGWLLEKVYLELRK